MKPIVAHQNSNLQRALLEASLREYRALPAEGTLNWESSPLFEKRMAHLIRMQKADYWKCVNTVGNRHPPA